MTKLRILIAEDHLDIAENIGDFLELSGHHVDYAYDGKMAVSLMESEVFDVLIMDVMMPKLDGLQATQRIRTLPCGDIPILMLTAKDTLDDKLLGFNSGADDYIVKPFDMPELYARIQAQVRKNQKQYQHHIVVNGIALNEKTQSADIDNVPLNLNPSTFKIMWLLTKAHPELVAKSEIEFALWGDLQPQRDILRSHIYNLRKSLSKCSHEVSIIGKHGQGYRLERASNKEQE
ncbi:MULTISPECIES: response regulator transcription factor [Pseudoalteromonas]|uniref:HoxA-like transcriptional regulator n=1 Tax=Pseudoalteromonas luteoviolacea (strain 2ta16) TaxID=1353533 RepID=V4H3Q3_PSEL2|nr:MULTISPECIES: response regulator transcription factor [Pseudoalteromonas]ESP92091.1 HoxA-like transcriptional regulator [Pseudoalteromonas luteoviolacea 2ta16]KZN29195.1 hypothetical protein N483_07115 [Pseudoalteromonas luteoviolacea NCIMB 1944]MCG7546822.1 response regulator transcription factor [Pseudoalteromonas sp. Of7M-16]